MDFSKEVIFLMNVPKKEGDTYDKKQKYSFTFTKPRVRTIIEVEHYASNICVFSFYTDGAGTDKTKYNLRFNYTGVHVLFIFKACLHIFQEIKRETHYALFFTASNNIGEYKEDNKRYSAYGNFFEKYLPEYELYKKLGALKLNILGIYHPDHPFISKVLEFYDSYTSLVIDELNRTDTSK